jgi:toxin ParE1/3/4
MKLRIGYSAPARKDLADIRNWTFKNFGADQANRYLAQLTDSLKNIAENPGLARDASDIRPELHKTVSRSHIVYFLLSETRLDVVRILHGSMDAGRWM